MTAITMAEIKSFKLMSYFTWNIEDYSLTPQLKSPIFAVDDVKFIMVYQKCDVKCTISMVPVVEDQESTVSSYAIDTSISLIRPNCTLDNFFFIQTTTNRNCSGQKECHIIWEQETDFLYTTMMVRGLPQRNIEFLCIFGPLCQYAKAVKEYFENPWCYLFDGHRRILGADLNDMRLNEDPSFVLKCGDKTFPVHEVILSARSKVFADMLRNKNVSERDAEIENMGYEVLENFITYIYSGRLKDGRPSVELLKKLYRNADKYKFEPLKLMVSSRLVHILNNAVLSSSPEITESENLSSSPEITESENLSSSQEIMENEKSSSSPEIMEIEKSSSSPEIMENEKLSSSPEITKNEKLASSREIMENEKLASSPEITENQKLSSSPEITENETLSSSPEILDKTSFCLHLLELLSMADEHEDKILKKSIIRCIVRNNFILTEDEWKQFRKVNEMLAMEVYDIFVNECEL